MKPANVEMLLFIKYNLRAVNYDINVLKEVPKEFVCPNHRVSPAPIAVEPQIDVDDARNFCEGNVSEDELELDDSADDCDSSN